MKNLKRIEAGSARADGLVSDPEQKKQYYHVDDRKDFTITLALSEAEAKKIAGAILDNKVTRVRKATEREVERYLDAGGQIYEIFQGNIVNSCF